MAVSRFSRRILTLIGLGVGVPALLLAILGIFLTLRISLEVDRESGHYTDDVARQVVEEFEREVRAHVRLARGPAANAARDGAGVRELIAALQEGAAELGEVHFVPVDSLDGYTLLIVDGQPLLYA